MEFTEGESVRVEFEPGHGALDVLGALAEIVWNCLVAQPFSSLHPGPQERGTNSVLIDGRTG